MATAEKLARKILGDDIALNGQLYVGYGGFIITYPAEHGKLINMVGVVRNDQPWNHEQWIVPPTKEDMVKDFEGWHPVLVDLISKFEVRQAGFPRPDPLGEVLPRPDMSYEG